MIRALISDASLLDQIWQFYELESSFWSGNDTDDAGRFTSLSGFLSRLGQPDPFDWAYIIRYEGKLAGLLIVGHQNFGGRSIMEFADLYVLPKYRGKGVASEAIRQTMLSSNEPWLVCVFREDRQALAFWRAAFERLAFTSVREVLQPKDPELHEFIVNEEHFT
ncbi:GNAT family N-acetyltransferase [Brevundimonas faecalis]|uniref:Acetyltransferase n=1 Tax=Brevundimonas faecalis TaxID=947378 RepID=A0ABV2R961_9CAUL